MAHTYRPNGRNEPLDVARMRSGDTVLGAMKRGEYALSDEEWASIIAEGHSPAETAALGCEAIAAKYGHAASMKVDGNQTRMYTRRSETFFETARRIRASALASPVPGPSGSRPRYGQAVHPDLSTYRSD